MSKIMQNLVVLMEPSKDASDVTFKAAKMILNRFCIDENAAFELSGVNYFKKSTSEIRHSPLDMGSGPIDGESLACKKQRKVKGNDYSFSRSNLILSLLKR